MGQGPGHSGQYFLCGPDVDFIQLLYASKRNSRVYHPGTEPLVCGSGGWGRIFSEAEALNLWNFMFDEICKFACFVIFGNAKNCKYL